MDYSVWKDDELVAVAEVGSLCGGGDRLRALQSGLPGVQVLWVPHADLEPEIHGFRLPLEALLEASRQTKQSR